MHSSLEKSVLTACGCFFALMLCGCDTGRSGSVVTREDSEKITVGMTESQVTAVLGKPTESMDLALPDSLASLGGKLPEGVELPKNGKRSIWRDGGRTIAVTFAGGKVVEKLFSEVGVKTEPASGAASVKPDSPSMEPFTQNGSFTVIESEQGVVNFAMPYALPPNVEISGSDKKNVVVTEAKPTGFKWKGVGTVHWGGEVTWTAKGIKATRIPEGEAK